MLVSFSNLGLPIVVNFLPLFMSFFLSLKRMLWHYQHLSIYGADCVASFDSFDGRDGGTPQTLPGKGSKPVLSKDLALLCAPLDFHTNSATPELLLWPWTSQQLSHNFSADYVASLNSCNGRDGETPQDNFAMHRSKNCSFKRPCITLCTSRFSHQFCRSWMVFVDTG